MSNLVPFAEMQQMANVLGQNKMFGKTPQETLALMLLAQAQGRHPAIVATEYDMIQGKPAINSKSALSRFQRAGGKIQWIERTDKKASAKFSHESGGELTVEWTIERAIQAQLTGKDNWKKFPAQMLSARVVAEGVRAVCPACLDGLYTSDEVRDFDAPKAPIPTEATEVIETPVKIEKSTAPEEPLIVRIENMFAYLEKEGISADRVLLKLRKETMAEIDGYDLSTIKALIINANSYGLNLNDQFPVIESQQETSLEDLKTESESTNV